MVVSSKRLAAATTMVWLTSYHFSCFRSGSKLMLSSGPALVDKRSSAKKPKSGTCSRLVLIFLGVSYIQIFSAIKFVNNYDSVVFDSKPTFTKGNRDWCPQASCNSTDVCANRMLTAFPAGIGNGTLGSDHSQEYAAQSSWSTHAGGGK